MPFQSEVLLLHGVIAYKQADSRLCVREKCLGVILYYSRRRKLQGELT